MWQYAESVGYIEDMLRKQLIAAIGKEVQPRDFSDYLRFHNRKLFRASSFYQAKSLPSLSTALSFVFDIKLTMWYRARVPSASVLLRCQTPCTRTGRHSDHRAADGQRHAGRSDLHFGVLCASTATDEVCAQCRQQRQLHGRQIRACLGFFFFFCFDLSFSFV